MPNGTLPEDNYLGDGERTTGEFQGGINELLNYVNSLKAEVDALSSQVIREAAVRGVGDATGSLTDRGVGSGATQIPDNNQIDARLGTSGNLGSAALRDVGTEASDVLQTSDADN